MVFIELYGIQTKSLDPIGWQYGVVFESNPVGLLSENHDFNKLEILVCFTASKIKNVITY